MGAEALPGTSKRTSHWNSDLGWKACRAKTPWVRAWAIEGPRQCRPTEPVLLVLPCAER